MAKGDITSTVNTDFSRQLEAEMPQFGDINLYKDFYSIATQDTEGTTGQDEIWYDIDWTKWHGHYRNIPEYAAIIDKIGSWTVGKGFDADEKTMKLVKRIKGFGKDDFNTLLENIVRTTLIAGDSFTEIIRDKAGRVINLKPLSPGSMRIVGNSRGIIKRYEQTTNLPDASKFIKFEPKQILHISWNRIADEIHGIPFSEKLTELIEMRNESMRDLKVMFHRYVKPQIIISVNTDDPVKINAFTGQWNSAYKTTSNIVVPSKTVESIERVSIPQFSTLDPLPWLKYLVRVFTTSCGVPEVIMGWGEQTTEASAKIIYLAYQQTIERIQRLVENQLELQTGIKIELEFPASLEPQLQDEVSKEGQIGFKPADTQINMAGKT